MSIPPSELSAWYEVLKAQVPETVPCVVKEKFGGDVLYFMLTLRGPGEVEGFVTAGAVPEDSRPVTPNTLKPGPYLGYSGVVGSPYRQYFTPVTPETLKVALDRVIREMQDWASR